VSRSPGGVDASPDSTVSLVAEKLVGGGRAIAHHDGSTWMVAGALPGERVRAAVTRRRAGIVEARTLEVVSEPHPARLKDPCPRAEVCGGCDWPHVDPIDGAALKVAAAAEAARTFPELARRIASAPIHASGNGYRLRAKLHWDGERKLLGFFEQQSHEVVSIVPCRILTPRFMRALPALEKALAERCPARVDVEWIGASDDKPEWDELDTDGIVVQPTQVQSWNDDPSEDDWDELEDDGVMVDPSYGWHRLNDPRVDAVTIPTTEAKLSPVALPLYQRIQSLSGNALAGYGKTLYRLWAEWKDGKCNSFQQRDWDELWAAYKFRKDSGLGLRA